MYLPEPQKTGRQLCRKKQQKKQEKSETKQKEKKEGKNKDFKAKKEKQAVSCFSCGCLLFLVFLLLFSIVSCVRGVLLLFFRWFFFVKGCHLRHVPVKTSMGSGTKARNLRQEKSATFCTFSSLFGKSVAGALNIVKRPRHIFLILRPMCVNKLG